MSIKGTSKEWYVGKKKSTLVDFWINRTDFNYKSLISIVCRYPKDSKPGKVFFNKKDGEVIKFKFKYTESDLVIRAIDLIRENNPELDIIEDNRELMEIEDEFGGSPERQNGYSSAGQMATWKLVSGIISIVLFVLVMFQSCAAGLVNTIEGNGQSSGSGGLLVSIMMLSGGIVSVSTRKAKGNGGNIALIVLFGIGAFTGFSLAGNFVDLNIWAMWCLINAVFAILSLTRKKRKSSIFQWGTSVSFAAIIIGIAFAGRSGALPEKLDDYNAKPIHVTPEDNKNSKEGGTFAENQESSDTLFKEGETAEMNGVKVTLSDYRESSGGDFNKPDDGNLFVLAEFNIENNTDDDLTISSVLSFDAYADDYSLDYSLTALLEKDGKQLDGTIAPGKKMKGWIGWEVPKDWGNIEIHFSADVWSGNEFVFLIEK